MLDRIKMVKQKMDESLEQLCEVSWMFSKQPGKNFTRDRKLPFCKLVSFLLAMEGGTLTTELLERFGCSRDTASASALVQQRSKLVPEAFPSLFDLFVRKTQPMKLYKGFRLFAVDGSDIQVPSNPDHTSSHYHGVNGQSSYNILHLDAIYDLLQCTYQDASLVGDREANERRALCQMVNRSFIQNALMIADRGYESYNVMAHIQQKGWKFLIRIQDAANSRGIAAGLNLPDSEQFDMFVDLALTTKQTNEVKQLLKNKNLYKYLHKDFDFLPKSNRKHDPAVFFKLPFRIVRFKISEYAYETVVTNLDAASFPPSELKKLYAMRWGIETSFRELKYTIGLLHFHAKKVGHIYQEVFARLIMYNFTELITSPVVLHKANCKYAYKANFTVAVHVCRQFFLGNVSPPDVEAVIRRNVSPIRPGRSRPRNMTVKHVISFTYRVA